MQDGAPRHIGGNTLADLAKRSIYPIAWPPYLPDLNPIETVWNKMKNFIAEKYSKKLLYN